MNVAEAPLSHGGFDLAALDSSLCQRYIAWLLGEEKAAAPEDAAGLVWALAHCDDGVTWGRYDADEKVWRLGNQVAPQVSPGIRRETLQELRLFGEPGEILIWRTDAGLLGRLLHETDPMADPSNEANPISPSEESRILRGTLVVGECDHGFTHISDGAGAEQVVPLAVSNEQLRAGQARLGVRHYYEADAKTGAVRIAVTRLVRLTSGGSHAA